jgi:WD40 repeat protein
MARVFVSHATADLAIATRIVDWLRGGGHDFFLCPDLRNGLAVGDPWPARLFDELSRADALLAVITTAFRESEWCSAEVGAALATGLPILPVRAELNVSSPLTSDETLQAVVLDGDGSTAQERLLEALRRIDGADVPSESDEHTVFPGLAPFTAREARMFFGRKAESSRLAERLRALARSAGGGLLPVVGRSGCGKSSLVRAGLVPLLNVDRNWLVLEPLVPGAGDAVAQLVLLLARAGHSRDLGWTVNYVAETVAQPGGITGLVTDLLGRASPARHLLLVVDQAEEILIRATEADWQRFAALLREATGGPVQAVMTIRSDYLDRLTTLAAETGLYLHDPCLVSPLDQERLRLIITGPARRAGITIDDELIARMVADTGSGEALPLLAFTLATLAEGVGRGGALPVKRYDDLKGVQGALARQAEEALHAATGHSAAGRTDADVLAGLLRLVTVDKDGQITRRRAYLDELSEQVRTEMAAFVRARLLTIDAEGSDTYATRDSAGGAAGRQVIYFTHEQILSVWPRLAEVIAARTDRLRLAAQVAHAAETWDGEGRPASHLWEIDRVKHAERALDKDDLVPTARQFLAGSRRRSKARSRIQIILAVGVAALLAASTIFAGFQWNEANIQRELAIAALVARAGQIRSTDPLAAAELSIAAYDLEPTRPDAVDSLLSAQVGFSDATLSATRGTVAFAFSKDGRAMATAQKDDKICLWDARDLDAIQQPERCIPTEGAVDDVAFSQDQQLIAGAGPDGITLWDTRTPQSTFLPTEPIGPNGIAFSTDSRSLIAGGLDGAMVWPVSAPQPVATRLSADGYSANGVVAVSPDGRTLATAGSDGVVTFWDLTTHTHTSVPSEGEPVRSMAFSPDGSRLATGADNGVVTVWDTAARPQIARITDSDGPVRALAFSGDGRILATSSGSASATGENLGSLQLWDVSSLTRVTTLAAPGGDVLAVAFSPDAHGLLAATTDKPLQLWTVPGDPVDTEQAAVFGALAVGPGGLLVTAGTDHMPLVWHTDADAMATTFKGPLSGVNRPKETPAPSTPFGMAISPDGRTVAAPASAADRAAALVWHLSPSGQATGQATPLAPFRQNAATDPLHPVQPLQAVAFAGSELLVGAAARSTDDVDLVSTATGRVVGSSISAHSDAITAVATYTGPYAPQAVAIGGADGVITVWTPGSDTHPGESQPRVLYPDGVQTPVRALAFTPDGKTLVSGSDNGTVELWNLDSHLPEGILRGTNGRPVTGLSVSQHGTVLAAVNTDGLIYLWHLPKLSRETPFAMLTGPSGTSAVAFLPARDGGVLATADQTGTPVLWDTDASAARKRLCDEGLPALTRAEWAADFGALPYQKVCG